MRPVPGVLTDIVSGLPGVRDACCLSVTLGAGCTDGKYPHVVLTPDGVSNSRDPGPEDSWRKDGVWSPPAR